MHLVCRLLITEKLTRMLPGSTLLILPNSILGTDGFHDVLIENLAASPAWRPGHVLPADVTALRRRWPKAVFKTMRRHGQEVKGLRRGARHRPDRRFATMPRGFAPFVMCRLNRH